MIKITLDNTNYIVNGDPISASALNKPSVTLSQNTTELAGKLRAYTNDTEILNSLCARLVKSSDFSKQGRLSVGGYELDNKKYYDIRLAGNAGGSQNFHSQIELYSKVYNAGRLIINHSALSDYFNGYTNSTEDKGRRLSNNGDCIAVKLLRNESIASPQGISTIKQQYSNYSSPSTGDDTYSSTVQAVDLVKLPLQTTATLTTQDLFSELQTAFSAEYNAAYSLTLSSSGVPIISSTGATPSIQAASLYITITDTTYISKVSKINLSNGYISSIELDTSYDSIPFNYQESQANKKQFQILANFEAYPSVFTVVKDYLTSYVYVATNINDSNYLYIPLITKTSNAIVFIDNIVDPIPLEEIDTSSYSELNRLTFSPLTRRIELDGLTTRITSVVSNPNTKGSVKLPASIAQQIFELNKWKQGSKFLYLHLSSISIFLRTAFSTTTGTEAILFRDSSPADNTYTNPLVNVEIIADASGGSNSKFNILTYGSYIDMSDTDILEALAGEFSILDFELSDSTKSSQDPPGTSAGAASSAVTTNSPYHIEVTVDIRFLYS